MPTINTDEKQEVIKNLLFWEKTAKKRKRIWILQEQVKNPKMKIFSKKFLICFFDFRGEVLKSAKSGFFEF